MMAPESGEGNEKSPQELIMKRPSKEEQRQLVRQWDETGRKLTKIRREALRGLKYNWEDVDALLALGDSYDGPPRLTSGLAEMQAVFMKGAPQYYKRRK